MENARERWRRLQPALLLPAVVGVAACGAAPGEQTTAAQQAYLDEDRGRLAVPPPEQAASARRHVTRNAAEPEPFTRNGVTFLPLPEGEDALLQARRMPDGGLRIGHGAHD